MAQLYPHPFDPDVTVLKQDLLYVIPGYPKATRALLHHFIDFGKAHANECFTMLAMQTNIKPRSLEKLGFTEVETLYRLEV